MNIVHQHQLGVLHLDTNTMYGICPDIDLKLALELSVKLLID